ncbi:MAG: UDP-N-acetylmuramoyl-tripeptide--D-alanyl-D-alanine ligase [Sediminibacterium sp.]|nr:UDP-N-acetylmuramoyl-tripeptide--D-alanyl-D-alanine ligase [Sediminibacterium sp.]
MQIAELYSIYLAHPSIQTDTRKLKQGDLFFALKGPNFNGNLFAQQALEQGAAYAVVDEAVPGASDRIILVEDVLTTLQQLAKYHRQQFNIPFIAITGSNGKTTSKELIFAVLSSYFTTYTTQGNLNNHIGVPLTILSIRSDAEMAVIEMGANHQQEIAGYCSYTLPTHGIITNCGKAHLEGFGGVEGVRKGKGELYDFLRANNGTAFVYADYDYLQPMSIGIPQIVLYGQAAGLVQGTVLANEPFLQVKIHQGLSTDRINSQLVGDYNLPNILCAATIGKFFGVPDHKIKEAIEAYAPSNSRSQLIEKDSNHIILDAYNANPSSMRAAIQNFANLKGDRKVLLLGAMMELGEDSVEEHAALVKLIEQYNWEYVVLVGGDFEKVSHPFTWLPDASAAREWLSAQHFSNTYLLIKGSRSFKMETVLG